MTSAAVEKPGNRWRGPLIRVVVIIALLVSAVLVIGSLVGDIDWSSVRRAMGQLHWWQLLLLVVGLLLRQWLNALPLSIYIKGVSAFKGFVNDQTAILMTTFAPPPSDIVMRVAMFTSWGVTPSAGLAGTAMNTLTFYVVRFGTPLLAIVLMAVTGSWHFGELWAAVLSTAVSAAIVVLTWLALRRREAAASIGAGAGRFVQRVRPKVDPQAWADKVVAFRADVVDGITRTFPRALLALVGMVVVDAGLIVLSIRFVGLSATTVPAVTVLTAFLAAYPLTLFPFQGLGVLDAVVISTLVLDLGVDVEPGIVAGFIIWRVVTIVTPLVLGAISILGWKFTARPADPAGPSDAA